MKKWILQNKLMFIGIAVGALAGFYIGITWAVLPIHAPLLRIQLAAHFIFL